MVEIRAKSNSPKDLANINKLKKDVEKTSMDLITETLKHRNKIAGKIYNDKLSNYDGCIPIYEHFIKELASKQKTEFKLPPIFKDKKVMTKQQIRQLEIKVAEEFNNIFDVEFNFKIIKDNKKHSGNKYHIRKI